jgi:hypothetical protein
MCGKSWLRALTVGVVTVVAACTPSSTDSPGTTQDTGRSARPSEAGVATGPNVTVPDAYTPVLVSVLGQPTFPFLGTDGKYHVAYDLELTNASHVPATLQKVEIVDGANPSRVVATFDKTVLAAKDPSACKEADCGVLRTLAIGGRVSNTEIAPNASLMMFVTFSFDSLDQAPKVVLHRVSLLGANSPAPGNPVPVTELVTPYNIAAGTPMVLAPPVRGRNWFALNGCCEPYFVHVTAANAYNGQLVNSQRFAIDWKRLNDRGQFFEGDRTKNESYVDYGAPIFAVADGTVEAVLDGLEPNDPGVLPADDPVKRQSLNMQTGDGNYIVLKLGNGVYANYAHLQKGTLKVKPGDKVKKGDVIALLGNTGNSSASHLHFHLMDGPSPLASNGLPYVIDSFEYVGQINMAAFDAADDYLELPAGMTFLPTNPGAPQPRKNQLPRANAIVNFPER